MDRASAIRKIRACLARAKSSTFADEAATAMRHAQALMAQFDVDHPELLAAGVVQEWARSRATSRPPVYEVVLANIVAGMYGCQIFFMRKYRHATAQGGYAFIGPGTAAEVASYSFTVLSRQLTKARAEYTANKLGRYTKNKLAAADLFCLGWVKAIGKQVPVLALADERKAALDAYMAHHHPNLEVSKVTERALTKAKEGDDLQHQVHGWHEGKKAVVHQGVSHTTNSQLQLAM